jgi:hypothetical protein
MGIWAMGLLGESTHATSRCRGAAAKLGVQNEKSLGEQRKQPAEGRAKKRSQSQFSVLLLA